MVNSPRSVWLRAKTFLLALSCLVGHAPFAMAQTGFVTDPAALAASSSPANAIRVQLVALRSTLISSEIAGRIAELSLKEGDRFSAGQRLVGLDCEINRARLNKAMAQVEELKSTFETNEKLSALGSLSELDLDVSRSRLKGSQAEAELIQALVKRCDVLAPFGGRVVKLEARRHQYVAEGQPLLEILDDRALEVELVVPSRWLKRLSPGTTFRVKIEETGKTYPARIVRTGSIIDPLSQSIKVYGTVTGSAADLLPGMSGLASFAWDR
jgi:RND family efflux transporter MFP subunit